MAFKDYISNGTTPFQVVDNTAEILKEKGYEELDIGKSWLVNKGGKYYTKIYGTTLVAFVPGSFMNGNSKFHIAVAHTDHPCFRIKPNAEMWDADYLKLDVEVYGGPILSTWLDRPLSIGGRVTVKSENPYEPRLYNLDFKRPLLTIPNLAIHMNRDANKGVEYNKQTELLPIIGLMKENLSKDNFLLELLAKEISEQFHAGEVRDEASSVSDNYGSTEGLNGEIEFFDFFDNSNSVTESELAKEIKTKADYFIHPEDILDFDLYVYCAESGCELGIDNELYSSPRLDNLTSCYALVSGLKENPERLNLIALYDNEEVGSRSKQGADSEIINIILRKIYRGLGFNENVIDEAVFGSLALSVDVAHGYHPNYGGKSDPNSKVICGSGFAIKLNYSQKYATDTQAVGIVQQLCEKNNILYQKYVNRSDIAGGGTIGSILSSHLPVRTVDIGVPVLAMHSARELMAIEDLESIAKLVEAFFEQ